MRVGVVGGKLQGIEAVYLCNKAGYDTVLIDKDPNAPAIALANETYNLDIKFDITYAKKILKTVDAVLPALENNEALISLEKFCKDLGIPFMQDNTAFSLTSDKLKSARFFSDFNIPKPDPWPCNFPVIIKPSTKSGSENVSRANTKWQLQNAIKKAKFSDNNVVIQEFVEGIALSLEVIADNGKAKTLQITGLEFDETYGCKRVYAPVDLSASAKRTFNKIGKKIAEKLIFTGLTDIQAILNDKGEIKVNEINARLPSQTPTVVYYSSGINMVNLLTKLFLEKTLSKVRIQPKKAVIYQHVKVSNNELIVQGEHILEEAQNLQIIKNFCGANEAITNLNHKTLAGGVATLIVISNNLEEAKEKMERVIERIMDEYNLNKYSDPMPNKKGIQI